MYHIIVIFPVPLVIDSSTFAAILCSFMTLATPTNKLSTVISQAMTCLYMYTSISRNGGHTRPEDHSYIGENWSTQCHRGLSKVEPSHGYVVFNLQVNLPFLFMQNLWRGTLPEGKLKCFMLPTMNSAKQPIW